MLSAESYTGLMTDGAHIWFEITWEFLTLAIGLAVGRYLLPRAKERFHRDLDRAHGIEHAQDGRAHNVDDLVKTVEYLNNATNTNGKIAVEQAALAKEQKERADALQQMLERELRKSQ